MTSFENFIWVEKLHSLQVITERNSSILFFQQVRLSLGVFESNTAPTSAALRFKNAFALRLLASGTA